MNSERNKALFLDRDGVINFDYGHVFKIRDFEFINGIFDLCRLAISKNYIIIVITNQAGIGKGYYSEDDFNILNNWMISEFKKRGVTISKTYHCPHKPEENCQCRKPSPGMLLKAINEFSIDVSKSIFIGDKKSDIESGASAKIKYNWHFTEQDHQQTINGLKVLE